MLLLGLTGSIATGKSTVSNILRAPPYNLPIIDADLLARQVVEPGTAGYAAIVKYFGPTTPDLLLPADDPLSRDANGQPSENGPKGKGRPLNRPALGRAVFGSGEDTVKARKVLNGIVHPAVRKEMWRRVVCSTQLCHYRRLLLTRTKVVLLSNWSLGSGVGYPTAVRGPITLLLRYDHGCSRYRPKGANGASASTRLALDRGRRE